jgi:hypothetical protein
MSRRWCADSNSRQRPDREGKTTGSLIRQRDQPANLPGKLIADLVFCRYASIEEAARA